MCDCISICVVYCISICVAYCISICVAYCISICVAYCISICVAYCISIMHDCFQEEKYEELLAAMQSEDRVWTHRGPANKRWVDTSGRGPW